MKAWRTRGVQQQFADDLAPEVRAKLPQRLGRLAKNQHTRILPTPSFLLQRMMIRVGLMQGA